MELPVTVPCSLCKADDFVVLYAPGVAQINQIVKCNRCGLMYANPRDEADCVKIEADQEDADFAEHYPQRYEKERLQVRDYADARALLARFHPNRGKLVEVGSSCGFQLDAFRKEGWDVLGVEPDRSAGRHAREKLGIQTITSTLEGAALPSESADAILMLHVIEHVPDPMSTLREVHRVLKPGGHLILETPRYDTLMYRLLGRRERSLSCGGHIYFFTAKTLRKAYLATGFELERLEYVGRTMTLDRLAFNLGVMSKSQSIQRALGSLPRWEWLHELSVTINVRDMQRVCVRKLPGAPAAPG